MIQILKRNTKFQVTVKIEVKTDSPLVDNFFSQLNAVKSRKLEIKHLERNTRKENIDILSGILSIYLINSSDRFYKPLC